MQLRMQNKYLLKKNIISVLDLRGLALRFRLYRKWRGFASTAGGGLLRKPMNQPLNGVAEIPQTHV